QFFSPPLKGGAGGVRAAADETTSAADTAHFFSPPSQVEESPGRGGAGGVRTAAHAPESSSNANDRLDWVRSHTTGRGADVVIEATGSPPAVTQAMQFARDAGRVVIVGQYTDAGDARFNPHADLNRKHLDVRASWGCDFSH